MNQSFKNILYIFTFWLTICAFIYQSVYWSFFGINLFEYVGFEELLSLASFSLIGSVILVLFVLIFELIFPSKERSVYKKNVRLILLISLVWVLVGGVVAYHYILQTPVISYAFLSSLIAVAVGISHLDIVKKYFKYNSIKIAFVIGILHAPFSALFLAKINANDIANDIKFSTVSFIKQADLLKDEYVYIGKLGDTLFVKELGCPDVFAVTIGGGSVLRFHR